MSQLTEQLQISHEFWQLCGGMVNVSCCIRHPKLINQKVVLERRLKQRKSQSFQTGSVQSFTNFNFRVNQRDQRASHLHLELLTGEKLEGGSSLETQRTKLWQLTEVISSSNFVLNLRASVC